MKSSAVAYLASKETEILPSRFERMAAANKLAIKQGKVWGIAFPGPKKHAGKQFETPRVERISKVHEVNAMRRSGVKAYEAAKRCNISYPTYRHWARDLGINEKFNSRWDNR